MTESFAARPLARRPAKIIVAILTDGLENASSEFAHAHAHIADLIAEKRAQTWEFVFLAANQDAIAAARRLSIPADDAVEFAACGCLPWNAHQGHRKAGKVSAADFAAPGFALPSSPRPSPGPGGGLAGKIESKTHNSKPGERANGKWGSAILGL